MNIYSLNVNLLITYETQISYDGHFKDDKMDGKGKYIFATGIVQYKIFATQKTICMRIYVCIYEHCRYVYVLVMYVCYV